MHELSVTQELLEIALRHGEAAGATRVTGLHLVIGDLSSIVDDSVQFYWDIVSQGTIAEGARIHMRRVEARFACAVCGEEYSPIRDEAACLSCGGIDARLVAGDEFHLEAIDIEEGEDIMAVAESLREGRR